MYSYTDDGNFGQLATGILDKEIQYVINTIFYSTELVIYVNFYPAIVIQIVIRNNFNFETYSSLV